MTCHDEDGSNKHDAENILITQTLHYGKLSLPINLCFYSPFWNNPPREITLKFRTPTKTVISEESFRSLCNRIWGYIIHCVDLDVRESIGEKEGWKRNLCLIWKIMAIITMISFIYRFFPETVRTVYIQPPFDTAALPVLNEYAHILNQEIIIAREYVPMQRLSLRRQDVIVDEVCDEIRKKGGFWDEHHGLRLEPWEHTLYREEYGIPPGATDIVDLCQNITRGLHAVESSFSRTMHSIAYGLPSDFTMVFLKTATYLTLWFPKSDTCVGNGEGRSCDPLGTDWLDIFRWEILQNGIEAGTRDLMKDMDKLDKDFKRALENLDLLISIASHLQQTPSWFELFRRKTHIDKQIEQLQQFHYNVTQMSTKVSSFIDTQTNILDQEAFFTEWLSSLILWSQTHRSPYKSPSHLNNNTINTNPWAIWRPREENGNWCTVPRCPEPNADGDNVLVKLVPPSAEQAYGYMYEFLEFGNKVKKELRARVTSWQKRA